MSAYAEPVQDSNRILWIDNLKAIGIILVVFAHNHINPLVTQFIYAFHMPLFFFLSGVVFNGQKYTFKEFLWRKINTRIKPYFILSFITFLFWLLVVIPLSVKGNAELVDKNRAFIGIFYGIGEGEWRNQMAVALWFLPCLFCVEVIFYILAKRARFSTFKMVLYTACIVAIGIILNKLELPSWRMPWSLDMALIAIAFFMLGYLGNSLWKRIQSFQFSITKIFITIVFISGGLLLSWLNGRIDMSGVNLQNPILFLITPAFFIIPLIYLFRRLDVPFLNFLGNNTLLILAYHFISLFVIRAVIYMVTHNLPTFSYLNLLENTVIVGLQILLIVPLIWFHNRFLQWVIK